jgi:dienelactone hydrolase
MTKYGKLIKFTIKDKEENPRNIQVFIPRNLDREVPAKVLWYFRGTNGVRITWNIETTRIYQISLAEKVVIVAPDLFNKVWSKGTDETDYYLVHDLIFHLKKLIDESGTPYKLDLENMGVIGFSAGGGFGYNLAAQYPKIFGEIVFRKFLSHARPLYIKVDQENNAVSDGGGQPDVQAYNNLKEAFHSLYAKEKPVFMLSIGLTKPTRKSPDARAVHAVQAVFTTLDLLSAIGYKTSLATIPGLGHRFLADYSKDFERQIIEFFFPIHITSPTSTTIWKISQLSPITMKITWQALPQVASKVDLELISAVDNKSYALGQNLDNSGVFQANSNLLPARTGRFFIKISTPDKLHFNYSDSFKIEFKPRTPQ